MHHGVYWPLKYERVTQKGEKLNKDAVLCNGNRGWGLEVREGALPPAANRKVSRGQLVGGDS